MTESWKLAFQAIQPPAHPRALADVKPLLQRLEDAFGCPSLGQLLNAKPSTVAGWVNGDERMSSEMERRVINLHFLFTRAFQVFSPESTMQWIVGSEPFFQGSRPIDVLTLRGVAPLIEALDNIDAGAYA